MVIRANQRLQRPRHISLLLPEHMKSTNFADSKKIGLKCVKVSESFKQLGKAAQGAGVQSATFGIFVDAGYLGLHRHTLQELKEKKGIADSEDYLDNITHAELSAIDFKNTLTEGKLTSEGSLVWMRLRRPTTSLAIK